MASLTIEDFNGQMSGITFPTTYEKLKDVLIKDSVVQIAGYTMHREMRGEKSVELRIEDVKPLDTDGHVGGTDSRSAGLVTITIWRATEKQMIGLRKMIESNPGDYEVCVQIMNGAGCIPIYLTHHVNPTEEFIAEVCQGLTRCEVDVTHNNRGGSGRAVA
jgi:DNA polymerase III alpha subunit